MSSEPEQWAVELLESVGLVLDRPSLAALTIQRAFEERERALREAAEVLRREAAMLHENATGCAQNHYGCDFELHGMPQWLTDSGARIFTATAALKDKP